MDLSKLSPEEKELLARAYDGEALDLSSVSPERKALLADAWDAYGGGAVEPSVPEDSAEPKMSASEAALIGAEDAATFGARGFVGGVGQAIGKGAGTFAGLSDLDLMERLGASVDAAKQGFSEGRAQSKAEKDKAFEDQLGASIGGEVVGSVLTAPVAAGRGLLGALKLGALGGAGTALSEADSLKEAAAMTAGGAATGGAVYGAGKALGAAAKGLKNFSGKQAFRALGPGARDARKALGTGKVIQMGNELVDEGVIGLIPRDYETIASRVSDKTSKAGAALGESIDVLDSLIKDKGLYKNGVRPEQVVTSALEKVRVPQQVPGAQKTNKLFASLGKEFTNANKAPMGLKEAEELKRVIGDQVNWNRLPGADIPPKEQFFRSLYTSLKDAGEETATKAAGLADDATSSAFKGAKKKFGLLKTAEGIVTDKTARDLANRLISPSDYLTGGLGAIAGAGSGNDLESRIKNAAIGGSLGLVNRYARTRGPQIAAKGSDILSKLAARGAANAGRAVVPAINAYSAMRGKGDQNE